jgi:hypothetical protein
MDRDDGAVQGYGFDLHAEDLRIWPLGKDAIQHPALRPPIHARIDRVPVAEPLGQPAPCAPLLGDVQDGGEHVQIVERHVAAWPRQARLDVAIRCVGDFPIRRIS